ncbi:hypothetical protein GGG16DRAFT_118872 [Schizophyllum commune]
MAILVCPASDPEGPASKRTRGAWDTSSAAEIPPAVKSSETGLKLVLKAPVVHPANAALSPELSEPPAAFTRQLRPSEALVPTPPTRRPQHTSEQVQVDNAKRAAREKHLREIKEKQLESLAIMEAEEVMSDMIAESTNILALADQDRFADAQKFQDKAVDPVVDDEKIDAEMASDKMVQSSKRPPRTNHRHVSTRGKVDSNSTDTNDLPGGLVDSDAEGLPPPPHSDSKQKSIAELEAELQRLNSGQRNSGRRNTEVRKRSAKAKVLSAARHLLIKQEIVNSTRVKQEPSSASLPAPLSGPHDPTPSRIPDFILAEREFWDAVLYAELFTTENPFLFCKHVTFVAICQQLLSQLWPSETYVIRYSDELFDKRPADDPSTFVVVQPITRLLLLLFLLSDTLFNIDHDEMGEGRKLEESANR